MNLLGIEILVGIILLVVYLCIIVYSACQDRASKDIVEKFRGRADWLDAITLLIMGFAMVPPIVFLANSAFGYNLIDGSITIDESNFHISFLITIFINIVAIVNVYTKPKFKGKVTGSVELVEQYNDKPKH